MLKGYKETKEKSKSQKDAVMFIKQKLDAAKWFIEAIKTTSANLICNYEFYYALSKRILFNW